MTSRRRLRARDQGGYAAILVALLAATVFMPVAALGVDTARWYVEVERVQKTADSAALAGVTYMPADLVDARATAIANAAMNGYDDASATVVVTAQVGDKPSELRVTVSSRITNAFAGSFGIGTTWITRSATADYTAPAPMGSPCNTFGNEPPSQSSPAVQPAGSALPTTPFPNCSSSPKFWAAIEGPNTDKVQGDRFMDNVCSGTSNAGATYGCTGGKNTEFRPEGYFWAVHVEKQAIGTPIDVQIYDPAFMYTSIDCSLLYSTGSLANYMNDYTSTDGTNRYGSTTANPSSTKYCSGDYNPGGNAPTDPPVTTFVLRHANDTFNPKIAVPLAGCTKQFVGQKDAPTVSELTQWSNTQHTTKNNSYDIQQAQLFHQWYSLCTFTPDVAGDYYLQVRTDVTTAGGIAVPNVNPSGTSHTSLVYTNNSAAYAATGNTLTGTGLNSFALRAVPSDTAKAQYVAMAGNEAMPILQNADSPATFNLIRALPSTKGQFIAFDFYDAADGAGVDGGSVQIIAPVDATGSIKTGGSVPNCQHAKNAGSYSPTNTGCSVTVKNTTHDGQVEHIVIPIPNDYNCDPSTLGGCWFAVQVTFSVAKVTDFTTWTASIGGDPVRLIE